MAGQIALDSMSAGERRQMETGSYRFELGAYQCVSVSDGALNYPVESFFANVPRDEVEKALLQHDMSTDQITSPYTCLFIDTGEHRVMIDTGAGNLGVHAPQIFPSVDHSTTLTGKVPEHLRSAGIEPAEVDIVIITHAHPDHVGGTLEEDGGLVFANAQCFISRAEWDFWTSEAAVAKAPALMVNIARQNLEPLRDQLKIIDGDAEIVPGISTIATPGHTPGHIALSITSDGERLLHISDVVLHPLHFEHPEWKSVFDLEPENAATSMYRIADHAIEHQALVFAHHFPPFPSLGHLRKLDAGWQWQSI
jgi:glyoxylase-like metal-dependent hydrolase (beta-lactamase superfamily II)